MLIGYARVSTLDQNTSLQSEALRKAGCDRIFIETASGAKLARPRLKAALRCLKPGDTFVVWKIDRLARSLRQLIDTIDTIERRGAGFRSVTEAIDTTTSVGRLQLQMLGACAEFERAIIRERTVAGLAAARAEGRIGGRRRKLSEGDVVQAREALAAGGVSVACLASGLGVGASTLYRQLKAGRPMLFGPADAGPLGSE